MNKIDEIQVFYFKCKVGRFLKFTVKNIFIQESSYGYNSGSKMVIKILNFGRLIISRCLIFNHEV